MKRRVLACVLIGLLLHFVAHAIGGNDAADS